MAAEFVIAFDILSYAAHRSLAWLVASRISLATARLPIGIGFVHKGEQADNVFAVSQLGKTFVVR
jgi:hypothetical protein